jgi:hypothetical protein
MPMLCAKRLPLAVILPNASGKIGRGGDQTVSALAERYLAEHARRRNAVTRAMSVTSAACPAPLHRAYAGIKRADVIERRGTVTAGKPTLANRVQSLISSMFVQNGR